MTNGIYLHAKEWGRHTMLIEGNNGATGYSAVFEDDGKVAYAYLLDDGRIVADVWLYNRAPAPEAPEWRDRSKAPFLNPRSFASEVRFLPPANESEVEFSWSRDAQGQTTLHVLIRGDCHAMLAPGTKPGWCKLAAKDGPLASVLISAEDVARAARMAMCTRDKLLGIAGGLIMVAVEVLVAYAFAIYVAAIVKSPAMLVDLLRFEAGDRSNSVVTWLSVLVTLLLPVFFFYSLRTMADCVRPDWRVRRLVKGSDMLGPTTYTIDNEGVRSTNASGSDVFLPWSTFDGIRTDADLAVLTRKGKLRFFVPLQAFARERDDVVTHLTSRVRSAA